MSDPDDILQSLVDRPGETINIELKSWIDPKSPEGEQKIARAALALRNQNGGYLVIGFNDKTGKPDPVPAGVNVRLQYHTDDIQRIITRYASHPFFIETHFQETGGVEYPVIRIPTGLKTPVVCKADLSVKGPDGKEKYLLRAKDIYVRTVNTNHTVSSAPWEMAVILRSWLRDAFRTGKQTIPPYFRRPFRQSRALTCLQSLRRSVLYPKLV